jgi:hypothetical protein
MNAILDAAADLLRFVYGFLVGDDLLAAVVMLAALILTAVMVRTGINAWWLVPLLAVVTTGVSLWRRRAYARR